ncbi:endo-1,4-beta-xylanase [Sphingomonas sp. CJ99]
MDRMTIDRRQLLGGAALVGASALAPAALAQTAPGLDAIARTRGLRFGSATASGRPGADRGSHVNPAYAALLERDCGLIVPENEMKWGATRPAADRFEFGRFDPMVEWATTKGIKVRGHTLLWNQTRWMPKWLNEYDFGARPASEAERLVTEHIRTVTARYGTRIYSYDVVNETVEPGTGQLYDNALTKAMGSKEAVVDLAFRTAREAAPHAELVYNDYMGWDGGDDDKHRTGVLKLLEGFRKRGVPVDTLGLQSHIGPRAGTSVAEQLVGKQAVWRAFLNEVTGMGYRLVITEFDVNDRHIEADDATRDRIVADYARGYLDVTLAYPQIQDVLAWGMSDKYSWLTGFTPRKDKTLVRGAPYDAKFRPKPLYDAIARSLREAPVRGTVA